MKISFYLVVGANRSVRTVKTKPRLEWDEIAVFCTLSLPDALFKKPSLSAEIVIPDSAAVPSEIPADVQENIREAIETVSGMEVNLVISNKEPQA